MSRPADKAAPLQAGRGGSPNPPRQEVTARLTRRDFLVRAAALSATAGAVALATRAAGAGEPAAPVAAKKSRVVVLRHEPPSGLGPVP